MRNGSTVTAYWSKEGVSWTLAGSLTLSMSAEVFVGLVMTSQSDSTLAAATFDGTTVTADQLICTDADSDQNTDPDHDADANPDSDADANSNGRRHGDADRVPNPDGDVFPDSDTEPHADSHAHARARSPACSLGSGGRGSRGDSRHRLQAAGTFTVNGSGLDIGGTSDEFHFVFRPLAGDGQIVARVLSVQDTGGSSKAGVMIREGLAANSPFSAMLVTSANRWMFFVRRLTVGSATSYSSGDASIPRWVKLVRAGNTVTAYASNTGLSWNLGGSVTISMRSDVLVGLVMTSQDNALLEAAVFESVTKTP